MKKVLVITYYWPPAGGSGVQRWLKLCKYLPEFDWEPIVYTPENPDSALVDPSLSSEVRADQVVVRLPIVEPRRVYQKLLGRGGGGIAADEMLYVDPANRSWKQSAIVWARSNLLIPDARALWIRPSIRFLSNYLEEHPVDAVVSTGPPHSMHLIGRGLKQRFGLTWIADFRDPWTEIVYFDRLPLTRFALRRHRKLETAVVREADAVVDVTPSWAEADRRRGARQVFTIFNGFDPSDQPLQPVPPTDQFTISHLGVLTADRNHDAFWDACARVAHDISEFKDALEVRVIGRADGSVKRSADRVGLAANLTEVGYLPHDDAIREMHAASLLLLPINRRGKSDPGIVPGKLFEYLASGRPILLIGPTDGDAAEIVQSAGAGTAFEYDDVEGVSRQLASWFGAWRNHELAGNEGEIGQFSRKRQAEQYAELLNRLAEGNESTGE